MFSHPERERSRRYRKLGVVEAMPGGLPGRAAPPVPRPKRGSYARLPATDRRRRGARRPDRNRPAASWIRAGMLPEECVSIDSAGPHSPAGGQQSARAGHMRVRSAWHRSPGAGSQPNAVPRTRARKPCALRVVGCREMLGGGPGRNLLESGRLRKNCAFELAGFRSAKSGRSWKTCCIADPASSQPPRLTDASLIGVPRMSFGGSAT